MRIIGVIILAIFISPLAFGQTTIEKSSGVTFSLPWVNSFHYYDYEKKASESKTGFQGFGLALFYKQDKSKVSFNIGLSIASDTPIGHTDYPKEGTRTTIASGLLEGLYHRKIYNNINLIGGINNIGYRYRFISYIDNLPSYFRKDKTMGLTLGTEYLIKEKFALALFYRPTIISFNERQYKHLISLDARFDLNIIKK